MGGGWTKTTLMLVSTQVEVVVEVEVAVEVEVELGNTITQIMEGRELFFLRKKFEIKLCSQFQSIL